MVGFALAEYSNGDDAYPVRLPFASHSLINATLAFSSDKQKLLPPMS
jgi:hypothetical protein